MDVLIFIAHPLPLKSKGFFYQCENIDIMITSQQLIHLAIEYEGDYYKIQQALSHYCFPNQLKYQQAITILDATYPQRLRDLHQPPFVLFYEGNLALLQRDCISIVGSRQPSAYAVSTLTTGFVHISKHKLIVSGGAAGIDGLAHELALHHAMSTLWVCAHGFNCVYPKKHQHLFNTLRKYHLVISEYPCNVFALPRHFVARNRLVAALGHTVLIMSGKSISGTMHTIRYAIELDRHLVTIPHPIDDVNGELCNQIIESGASMLTNVREFATL